MNLTQKITLALGLALAGASYAQTSSTVTPVGVLGQQFTELSFGTSDIRHVSPNFYDLSLAGNVPVAPNVDLGASYGYGWIGGAYRGHANQIEGTGTFHTNYNGVKPFVSLGLGYQWASFKGGYDDLGLWGASVGVEIPAGALALTPRIVYADDFRGSSRSSQQTSYEVEGNYWVSRTTAVFGSVGFTDTNNSGNDSWDYRVGLRLKF
ncbi:MAG TPA: hypothetical protein VHD62_01965 [Opitutaceae bacterium]|nr:hypothetical protein [Opitutaceae bacterium]